jgi:hypothetical protein
MKLLSGCARRAKNPHPSLNSGGPQKGERAGQKRLRTAAQGLILACGLLGAMGCQNVVSFRDEFTTGAAPQWGNERGSWIAGDGVYHARQASGRPLAHTMLPYDVGDGAIELDVNGACDGGIWVHVDAAGNGLLLVAGGNSDAEVHNSLYWHTVHNYSDDYGEYGVAKHAFEPRDNIHLRIEMAGDTYKVYLNRANTAISTLVNAQFPHGRLGLYDNAKGQTFGHVQVTGVCVPEKSEPPINADGRR